MPAQAYMSPPPARPAEIAPSKFTTFLAVTFNKFISLSVPPLPSPFWCDPSFTRTFKVFCLSLPMGSFYSDGLLPSDGDLTHVYGTPPAGGSVVVCAGSVTNMLLSKILKISTSKGVWYEAIVLTICSGSATT